MRRLAICVFSLLFADLAWAEVYKWTDASGQVQYSDQPPASSAKRDVVRINKTGGFSPVQSTAAAPAAGAEKKPDEAAANKPDQETIRKYCKQATSDLQDARDAGTHTVMDAKGKEHDLNEAELKATMAKLQKTRDDWCKLVK